MDEPGSIVEVPDTPDYYSDLGLEQMATFQEIKKAHHSLAKKYHPDKQGLGACIDAHDFRRIRKAFEFLRDPFNRSKYDMIYPELRERWSEFRTWEETERKKEELRKADKKARERRAAETEMKRRMEEQRCAAREKFEQERKEAQERDARRRAEEERLTREREEREELRKRKKEMAERKTKEVAERARKQQEHAARERLRKQKELEAEQRSQEAARRARQDQEAAAEVRLKTSITKEKQDVMRQNWAKMREVAELRVTSLQARAQVSGGCQHPHFGWPRKNGKTNCAFCEQNCSKFYFHCPQCSKKACQTCKVRYCKY